MKIGIKGGLKVALLTAGLQVSTVSHAWIPCAPICDMMCMGLSMALGSAMHTMQVATVSAGDFVPATLKMAQLGQKMGMHGVKVSKAWGETYEENNRSLLLFNLLQKSHTQRITSALSGASSVLEATSKARNKVISDINLSTQNAITNAAKNSIKVGFKSFLTPDKSNIDTNLVLAPAHLMSNRGQLNKFLGADMEQYQTVKEFIRGQKGKKSFIYNSSQNARIGLLDAIYASTLDFDVKSDPYLARVDSIPFRLSTIRRNRLAFESSNGKGFELGNVMHNKPALYGAMLVQRNIGNILKLDSIDTGFSSNLN